MRKTLLLLVIVLSATSSACTLGISKLFGLRGSGTIASFSTEIGGFSAVNAGFGLAVTISQGDAANVTIYCDDNIIERIKYEVIGGELRFFLDPPLVSINPTRFEAHITMPVLEGLTLSGGAHALIGMATRPDRLSVTLSGGAYASGSAGADAASFELSGGSYVELNGACRSFSGNASGGSQFRLKNFSVSSADVILSGGAVADMRVNDFLSATISGGSILTYYGSPSLGSIVTSGGGAIRKGF